VAGHRCGDPEGVHDLTASDDARGRALGAGLPGRAVNRYGASTAALTPACSSRGIL
jgi:hypothetical protein